MIAIFDYGAGNLQSVKNTLAELNCEYTLIRDSAGLRQATKILLPGVGHFGQMMRALDELDVRTTLLERIRAGVPFLGICLGMQALFESSEEAPEVPQAAAVCTYGLRYTAALEAGNVSGVQFHPEKSGPIGLRIVRNFL